MKSSGRRKGKTSKLRPQVQMLRTLAMERTKRIERETRKQPPSFRGWTVKVRVRGADGGRWGGGTWCWSSMPQISAIVLPASLV